jgi:hypothetical protein
MSRVVLGAAALAAILAVAACGERPQVTNFKQGKYAGKPDTPAYHAAPFNGDRAAWERIQAQSLREERVHG